MKKIVFYLILFLSISYLTSCASPVQHSDPFYNVNYDDYPLNHLPLIKPISATRHGSSSHPWGVSIIYGLSVPIPNKQGLVLYAYGIRELEKFAVENGVIVAYSAYVDTEANAYIQDNYYHWFVLIPNQEIAEGFHTETEFWEYIQTLGIQEIDWQTPGEAYEQFAKTGCLEWIPDCTQP